MNCKVQYAQYNHSKIRDTLNILRIKVHEGKRFNNMHRNSVSGIQSRFLPPACPTFHPMSHVSRYSGVGIHLYLGPQLRCWFTTSV